MNVIHALAWYFPESTGGTEVYVSGLVEALSAGGTACTIAAAQDGTRSCDYKYNGVAVHRYPFAGGSPAGVATDQSTNLAAIRGERPYRNFDAFVDWLGRRPRGIYHQHSWTTSCGLHHIAAAKSLGFRTVLTVHVPGNICLRGTMMELGAHPCDGHVETERCAACWSQSRGLSRSAALAISRLPQAVSRAAYRSGIEYSLLTAFAARELAATRQRQIAAMAGTADRVVAVCGWLAEALRINGVAEEKLLISRQGVDGALSVPPKRGMNQKFRLGFLGRCDPVKGLAVLLDAMALLPRELALELVVYAIANTEADRAYRDRLVEKSKDDPRITFKASVDRADLATILSSFDMLAVPSQWLETGPLVVLEAKACGVPVLGSDLGGIAELIEPDVDGHLVAFSDAAAWADAIAAAVGGTLPCLRVPRVPRLVRTMADAAQDMSALYASLL